MFLLVLHTLCYPYVGGCQHFTPRFPHALQAILPVSLLVDQWLIVIESLLQRTSFLNQKVSRGEHR